MGLSLEFYIGDTNAIISALEDCDYDRLDEPGVVNRRADLSLHLIPDDLNLLSLCIGAVSGHKPLSLRPHLSIIVDEADYGVLEVSQEWTAYAASVPNDRITELATAWAQAMSRQHGEEIQANSDLQNAVRELVALCVIAHRDSDRVLHAWNA